MPAVHSSIEDATTIEASVCIVTPPPRPRPPLNIYKLSLKFSWHYRMPETRCEAFTVLSATLLYLDLCKAMPGIAGLQRSWSLKSTMRRRTQASTTSSAARGDARCHVCETVLSLVGLARLVQKGTTSMAMHVI